MKPRALIIGPTPPRCMGPAGHIRVNETMGHDTPSPASLARFGTLSSGTGRS